MGNTPKWQRELQEQTEDWYCINMVPHNYEFLRNIEDDIRTWKDLYYCRRCLRYQEVEKIKHANG
jgi:hypothetical protein